MKLEGWAECSQYNWYVYISIMNSCTQAASMTRRVIGQLPNCLSDCSSGFVSTHVVHQWCTRYCITKEVFRLFVSLVPRPSPSFLSLTGQLSGEDLVHFLTWMMSRKPQTTLPIRTHYSSRNTAECEDDFMSLFMRQSGRQRVLNSEDTQQHRSCAHPYWIKVFQSFFLPVTYLADMRKCTRPSST